MSLTLALAGSGTWLVPSAQAVAPTVVAALAPPGSVSNAVLAPRSVLVPDQGCTSSGGTTTCDLYAKEQTGVVLTPGTPAVRVWSFTSGSGDPITAPVGPTLVVNEGQTVRLVLHNAVPGQSVALAMPQIDDFPQDAVGIATGEKTYEFHDTQPGTYLYEAGGSADGARQVAMGLMGALVVLPSPAGTAYGTQDTAYSDEGVIVMSDVDPGLNADPLGYDMRNFAPRYHLFNGKTYPSTDAIEVQGGKTALLRVINAGTVQHSIAVLGTEQSLIAESGRKLKYPYGVGAEIVPAGDTKDLLVSVPAAPGLKYAVYDPTMRLDNDGAVSSVSFGSSSYPNMVTFGGGLTFLQEGGVAAPTDVPPVVDTVAIAPPTRVSSGSLPFTATITDADSPIAGARFVVDDPAAPDISWTQLTTVVSGGFGTQTVTVSGTVPAAGLATGTHQLLVSATDATGYGASKSAAFQVDTTGPTVAALTPAKAFVNGSSALAFTGSATDVGGGRVLSATWKLDGTGTSTAATVTPGSGSGATFTGSIPAATLGGLTEGSHTIAARAVDDLGNAGADGPAPVAPSPVPGAAFVVDTTAPTVASVAVTPSPNNGSQGVAYDATSIEVRAVVSDANGANGSGVASGEGFIGTPPADASVRGFTMVTNTSGGPLAIVGTIPLSQLTSLPDGITRIYVRAVDKAGNWGSVVSGDLVLSRTATVSGLTLTPATASTAASVALAGTATTGAGQTVTAAEYFIDGNDPGAGLASKATLGPPAQTSPITATINVAGLTVGPHSVSVRARSSSGAWSPVVTTPLALNPLFADGFEAGPAGPVAPGAAAPWSSATATGTGVQLDRTAGASMTGTTGLAITLGNIDNLAWLSTPDNPEVPTVHVAFQLDRNTLRTQNRWVTVYRAMGRTGAAANTELFRVEYRRNGATTATAQVRLVVHTGNGAANTTTVPQNGQANLTAGANLIRVDWTSAAANQNRPTTLTVNGAATTRTGLNTSNRALTSSQLGVSQAPGTQPGNGTGQYSGSIYLDAFTSAFYGF
jgi:hypothetical protein